MNVLLTGRQFKPADAVAAGLAHEVAATPAEMLDQARAWIAANPSATAPWDRPSYKIPGARRTRRPWPRSCRRSRPTCASSSRARACRLGGDPVGRGRGRAGRLRHRVADRDPLPGVAADRPGGQEHDGRVFFDMKAVNSGASRPAAEAAPTTRVAVLGAGMMGAGIAYVCAKAACRSSSRTSPRRRRRRARRTRRSSSRRRCARAG